MSHAEPIPVASKYRWLAVPAFVLVCWGLAVRHLSSEWTLSEQYNYGWIVPLLVLYVLRIRLEKLPPPGLKPWPWTISAGLLLIALAEALILPVQAANADWRLLGWALTGLASVATLLLVTQVGGLPWLMHLAFPVLFFFTAVPWPRPIEMKIMQELMVKNAWLAAELLHWLGVQAEVQGNLIRLKSSTVGINEACSGIRSFQGSLMATLFIGEIFELSRGRRFWLLLVGAGLALITNIGRTLFLSLMTDLGGMDAHDRWHDPAGFGVLGACVAGVTFTGWMLSCKRGYAHPHRSHALTPLAGTLAALSTAAIVGVVLIVAGWGATEAWFRAQESATTRLAGWRFRQPSDSAGFELVEQSKAVRGDLRYDFHSGGRWRDAEGRQWVAHYFRWEPGRNAVGTVLVHDPRACLGGTGKQLVQVLPPLCHQVGDVVMPFDAYWFRDQGGDVFVFNCVVEDVRLKPGQQPNPNLPFTISDRMEAVRAGRRNQGQRRLEVGIWGAADAATARTAIEQLLNQQVEPVNIIPKADQQGEALRGANLLH